MSETERPVGYLDLVRQGRLHGWHRDVGGAEPLILEIDGQFVGVVTEIVDRPDVLAAGHAGLKSGFRISVPARLLDDAVHRVVLRGGAPESRLEAALQFPREEAPRPVSTSGGAVIPHDPATGSRAAVVCWDLAHNPAGRGYVLVRLLQQIYDAVDLIGPLHPRFGTGLWPPLEGAPDLNVIARPLTTYAELRAFERSIIEARQYDFVHVCKPRLPAMLLGTGLAEASGCPIALDIDDHEMSFFEPRESTFSATRLASTPQRVSRGRLSLIDAEATAFAETLIEQFKLRTVSNIALQDRFGGELLRHSRSAAAFDPTDEARLRARTALGYAPEDRVIMFVGTIRRHKGVLAIAEAIAELGDPRVRFCLMGPVDGPGLREDLLRILGSAIALHDGVPLSELPTVLAAADLVCLPQDLEHPTSAYQIPAKLTDALAMGVPAIVENLPPYGDLAGLPGVIVRNEETLGRQIARVLDDPPDRHAVRDSFLREFSDEVGAARLRGAVERSARSAHPPAVLVSLLDETVGGRGPRGAEAVAPGPRAPQLMRRVGKDVVFLWKQNDSGVFGRRSDMVSRQLIRSGYAGRLFHFDASISLDTVTELASRADRRLTADRLVYQNTIGRWLGLQDGVVRRDRTFIFDEQGRSFMGTSLPRPEDLASVFRRMFRDEGLSEEAVLWVCPVSFDVDPVLESHAFGRIVADLIDDQRAFPASAEHRQRLTEGYRATLSRADVTFANCAGVARRLGDLSRTPPIVLSNASEREGVSLADAVDLFPGEDVLRVGYVGNMRDRFDHELIARLAGASDRYRIILIGPTGGNAEVEALGALPNVVMTGPVKHEEANRFAAAFDIAIVPHLSNPLSETMNPLKVYVYQALGLPIVATDVDNLHRGTPGLFVARDADQFLELVARLGADRAARGVPRTEGPFWDDQVRLMVQHIEATASDSPGAVAALADAEV